MINLLKDLLIASGAVIDEESTRGIVAAFQLNGITQYISINFVSAKYKPAALGMRIEAQSVEFIMDKVQECLARGIHDLYVVLVKAPKKAKTESSKLKDLDRSIRTLSSKKSLDLSRQERIKAALNQINSIMGDLYGNKVENHKAGSNKSKPSGLSVVGGRGFDWADRANYRVNRTVKSERSRAALKLVG